MATMGEQGPRGSPAASWQLQVAVVIGADSTAPAPGCHLPYTPQVRWAGVCTDAGCVVLWGAEARYPKPQPRPVDFGPQRRLPEVRWVSAECSCEYGSKL